MEEAGEEEAVAWMITQGGERVGQGVEREPVGVSAASDTPTRQASAAELSKTLSEAPGYEEGLVELRRVVAGAVLWGGGRPGRPSFSVPLRGVDEGDLPKPVRWGVEGYLKPPPLTPPFPFQRS